MARTTILTVLLIAAGIQLTIQQNCHVKDLQACIDRLTKFANTNPVPFPANQEELDSQCASLAEARECAYNYSLKCVSEMGRNIGDIIFSSVAQKMKNFCQTGHEFNSRYLRNSQCMTENYGPVSTCAKTVLAAFEAIPKKIWKEKLPATCCAIGQFRSCAIDHYTKVCSEETTEIIKLIFEFGLTDVFTDVCTVIEDSVTCPDLPPPGTPLDGSHKNNLIGTIVASFVRD